MNEYRNLSDIISNIFDSISTEDMKETVFLINTWKSVLLSIKSRTNKAIGELLVAHTKIIDLKNGVLLIETDHPGYIQTLQMYNSYILKGLSQKVPELEIKSLSFRLKGTDYKLTNIEKKEETKKMFTEEEINNKFEINENLPEELKEKFKELKENFKKRYIDQK